MNPPRSPQGPSVMLVQASASDREMYAEFLQACGFAVVQPPTTADALAQAAGVDLIVTGVAVPGPFGGIELIRRLREGEATRHLPIVVVTASVLPEVRTEASRAGCDSFLTKPCLPDVLAAEIRQLLEQRGGRATTPSVTPA